MDHHKHPVSPARTALLIEFLLIIGWILMGGLTLLLGGCGFQDWEAPQIKKASPQGKTEREKVFPLTLRFSEPMNRKTAEKAFRCTRDGSPLSGGFRWIDDQTLTFTPDAPPERPFSGSYTLSEEAEDLWGNNIRKESTFNFTTRQEETPPVLRESLPPPGGILTGETEPLELRFSEAIHPPSFVAAWSLSPEIPGFFLWEENFSQLTFTPAEPWKHGITYRWRLEESLEDNEGNPLGNEETGWFTRGNVTTPPQLERLLFVNEEEGFSRELLPGGLVNEEIPTRGSLIFIFSEEMQEDLSEKAAQWITGDPPPSWEAKTEMIDGKTRLICPLTDPLPWNCTGTLKVNPGPQDTHGNRLIEETSFFYRSNHPQSEPPRVDAAYIDGVLLERGIPLNMSAFHEEEGIGCLAIHFTPRPDGAALDPVSLWEALSLTTSNSQLSATALCFELSGNIIKTYWQWQLFDTAMATVRIAAGVKDLRGLASAEDWTLSFPME